MSLLVLFGGVVWMGIALFSAMTFGFPGLVLGIMIPAILMKALARRAGGSSFPE